MSAWRKECPCGSGKEANVLHDARGISCGFVCDSCIDTVKAKYRPEIFEDASYDAPDLGDDVLDPDWDQDFGDW